VEEDLFLCEKYAFSRWLIGRKIVQKDIIKKAKVIVPADSDLNSAFEERDWIQKFGKQKGLEVSVDSSYEEVINTLKSGDFDLLHFSTHGKNESSNPLLSFIILEDGIEIRPENIVGVTTRFGKTHPVIILNACQSGTQSFSLTGVQGWATRFLDAGASVFIGTLWSVSDQSAVVFTKELYNQLTKGTTLGEAVRIARSICKKAVGDPSWLAYELYGQPNIIIRFGNE
jgi:CHAT domain-containing protein